MIETKSELFPKVALVLVTALTAASVVEGAPTINYRSIGTNTGILASTGTASVSPGSAEVTFGGGASLPANSGVGDRLILDPGGPNQEIFYILSRDSAARVTVQSPATNGHSRERYEIRRAYNTLQQWETDRQGDLVAENRKEIGVAYNDGAFTAGLTIDGSTTDNTRFLKLTVARGHRHDGTDVAGARVDGGNTNAGEIIVRDDDTVVEWLVLSRTQGSGRAAVQVDATNVLLTHLVINNNESGIRVSGAGNASVTVRNTIIHTSDFYGIRGNGTTDAVTVENSTVYASGGNGIDEASGSVFTVTNTLALGSGGFDFEIPNGTQSHNMSSDATASGTGSLVNRAASDQFVNISFAPLDLHLTSTSEAIDAGTDLSASFFTDIDLDGRPGGALWDMGADEFGAPPASVQLSSSTNQTFTVGEALRTAATMTVTDAATPMITAAKDLRIRIPAEFSMHWDTTVTAVSLGGSAAPRVSSTVKAYEDFDKTVVLDVVSDLAPGDQLTIDGLVLSSFTAPSPADNFELETEDDDLPSAFDDKTIEIVPDSSPNISSDDHQVFTVGQTPTPAETIFITESLAGSSINDVSDIRIHIPSAFPMEWDTSVTSVGLSGNASSKVSSSVSYEGNQIVVINVITTFAPGEFVSISGLRFQNFSDPSIADNLELEVDGAGIVDLDDKTIAINNSADVQFFTATATDLRVKLEWINPEFGACANIFVFRKENADPSGPFDGALIANPPCTLGKKETAIDTSVVNFTTYHYAIYVEDGASNFTPGEFVTARPFTTTGPVKWAYSTGATSMAPPGLRFFSGAAFVYVVSNDYILHAVNGGASGGDWPLGWTPFTLGWPAQARPPVVPFKVGSATNGAVFLGAQDGNVYAVDADSGAKVWAQPIASLVQAAPAGNFIAFDASAHDIILAGTRNSGAANTFEALDVGTGAPVWTFDNSSLSGGDDKLMGIISASASVDYTNQLVFFASREHAAGSSNTVWCVDFASGAPALVWAKAIGNIDGSPILYSGVVYVGTNAGDVYALDAATGNVNWSLSLADGPVKGFVFPQFGTNNLFVSTNTRVWSIADNGGSGSVNPNWPVTDSDVPSPSTPLFVPGSSQVLVGSSDGNLYQLDAVDPLPAKLVQLGDGNGAVGVPTMDLLNNLIYVGTEQGIIYGVKFPLP